MSRRKLILTSIGVVLALAVLLSLGTWQVNRLHWKEALLAQIEARRHAPPVSLAEAEAAATKGQDAEYLPVSVQGTFNHAGERHFFATFEGQSGFYIYTPLTLADGRVLFVNRGFVPYEMKEAATRAEGQVSGPEQITGFLRQRLGGKPSWLVPENDVAKNIFYWKDWDRMVSSDGLDPARVLPFFVDADESVKVPGGWPKAGVTQFDLPNNHLQYAVTWYGLALALLGVVLVMIFRRKVQHPQG